MLNRPIYSRQHSDLTWVKVYRKYMSIYYTHIGNIEKLGNCGNLGIIVTTISERVSEARFCVGNKVLD